MKRLLFAEPAEKDLVDIIDYIALESPVAAERVYRAILNTTERLRDFPDMGRSGRLAGTREFPVPALPYLVVYQVSADAVTVVAVFHTSRDLPRALAERRSTLKS